MSLCPSSAPAHSGVVPSGVRQLMFAPNSINTRSLCSSHVEQCDALLASDLKVRSGFDQQLRYSQVT